MANPIDYSIERWKAIADCEGYEISDLGRVRSLPRHVHRPSGPCFWRGRILCTQICPSGYPKIKIRGRTFSVHALVARAFLEPPEFPKPQVNHKNGVRSESILNNLEWVSHAENQRHSYRELGRKPSCLGKRGAAHNCSIRVIAVDTSTGEEISFGGVLEAARTGRFSKNGVSRACRAEKIYNGFRWRFDRKKAAHVDEK